MLKLKTGVSIQGVRPELLLAILVAQDVWQMWALGDDDLVVTSVIDGRHSRNSLHYSGCAMDLRLPDTDLSIRNCVVALAENLGNSFDVIRETTHIHVEYQPGKVN